jgi:putative transposase
MMTIEELEKAREERGSQIAHKERQVKRIDENVYTVLSQSGNGEYAVSKVEDEWVCECPDFLFRKVQCKHIFAVLTSIRMKEQVKKRVIIKPLDTSKCVYCGSEQIVRDAVRHNKKYDIQRYLCKACGKRFSVNIGFEGMKASPQVITSAMQLYFTGESLRNVQKFLKLQGVSISHVSILKWIRKYVTLMNEYLEKIKPQVSDTWRADELWVKINGDMKYLFALMDDETRFWIAQEVAESKDKHDAAKLFLEAEKVTRKQPETLITDGLQVYTVAKDRVFPNTNHVRHIRFHGDMNNNKMERLNGEVRDREKTMRGLKKGDTPILKGYQLFHNFIKPHEGLNGKTPAEACGIKVKGENKWKTLIENARARERSNSH